MKKYAGGIIRGKLILLLIELKSLAIIQTKAAYPIGICVSIFILEGRFEEHSLESVFSRYFLDSWKEK